MVRLILMSLIGTLAIFTTRASGKLTTPAPLSELDIVSITDALLKVVESKPDFHRNDFDVMVGFLLRKAWFRRGKEDIIAYAQKYCQNQGPLECIYYSILELIDYSFLKSPSEAEEQLQIIESQILMPDDESLVELGIDHIVTIDHLGNKTKGPLIDVTNVKVEHIANDCAVLTVSTFSPGVAAAIRLRLKEIKAHFKDQSYFLIIDFRKNIGGSIREMKQSLSALVPQGTVMFSTEKGTGPVLSTAPPLYQGDIVILQGENTASAAETATAALIRKGAVAIGQPTFGKLWISEDITLESGHKIRTIVDKMVGSEKRLLGILPHFFIEPQNLSRPDSEFLPWIYHNIKALEILKNHTQLPSSAFMDLETPWSKNVSRSKFQTIRQKIAPRYSWTQSSTKPFIKRLKKLFPLGKQQWTLEDIVEKLQLTHELLSWLSRTSSVEVAQQENGILVITAQMPHFRYIDDVPLVEGYRSYSEHPLTWQISWIIEEITDNVSVSITLNQSSLKLQGISQKSVRRLLEKNEGKVRVYREGSTFQVELEPQHLAQVLSDIDTIILGAADPSILRKKIN